MSNNHESNPVNQALDTKKAKKLTQYAAAVSANLGAMGAGAVLGWTGNISANMVANTYNGIKIDDDSLSWIGGWATLGATVACLLIGKFCDMLGRKPAMLLLTIPFTIGWLLIIFADGLLMLYIGRFLTGMAGFAFGVSCPIYTTEIAETEIRGELGSYFELFLVVGVLFAYGIAMVVDMVSYTIVMAIIPLAFAIIFVFQPESPVFLLKHNKEEQAKIALNRLRGNNYDVDIEIRDIKASLAEEQNKMSVFESVQKKGTQKAILICFSLMFLQKAGGVCVVEIYTDYIFTSSGSHLNPNLATLIIGIIQVIATFGSSVTVDRLGRRILLISSTLIMAIATIALGIFFTLWERKLVNEETIANLGFLPITSVAVFIITFSMGIGTIVWNLSAELFPPEIKSSATGAAAAVNWFTGFLTTKFYMDLKNAVGTDVTFYIFSIISLCGTVFIYFIVPETKGKSLEEIQRELNGETVKEKKQTVISLTNF